MKRPTIEEINEKIREFAKKKCNTIGMHNMYYIFSEDMDGNVTGEAYAINSYTDLGLKHVHVNGYAMIMNAHYTGASGTCLSGYLHFGTEWPEVTQENPNAGTPLDPNFRNMYNEVFNVYFGTKNGSRYWYNRTVEQDPLDLTFNSTFLIGTVPYGYLSTEYNYNNLTEDVQIKELGIVSYGASGLTLHTHVLDENGDPSYILKRPNEKLTVYVYGSHCTPISLMTTKYDAGWNNSVWNIFNAELLFVNPQYLWYTSAADVYYKANTVTKNNRKYSHDMCGNQGTDSNTGLVSTTYDEVDTKHQVRHNSVFPNLLLEGSHDFVDLIFAEQYVEHIVSKISNYYRGIVDVKFIQQNAADADVLETTMLTCDNGSDSWWDNNYKLTNMFGVAYDATKWKGLIPSTYFTLQELKMFNIQTNTFDIVEQFSAYDDLCYHMEWIYDGCAFMKWPNNNSYKTAVFMNPNPQYEIKKFEDSYSEIYASDTWWDVTSWDAISDLNSVPQALSKKRYYMIKWEKDVSLHPRYDEEPRIIPASQFKDLQVSLPMNTESNNNNCRPFVRVLGNDVNHFIVGYSSIVCLDSNKDFVTSQSITGYNDEIASKNHRFYYGTKVCILSWSYEEYGANVNRSGRGARIYDVSDPTNITYTDIIVDPNTNVANNTYVHHEGHLMNDKPYVVFWDKILNSNNKYCFQVLDFSQSNVADMVTEFEDAINPRLVAHSDFIVYRDATDMEHLIFKIYNLSTKQTVHTFQLSDAYFGTVVGCNAYSPDGTLNGIQIYLTIKDVNNNLTTYHYTPYTSTTTVSNTINVSTTWTDPTTQWFGCEHCALMYVSNTTGSTCTLHVFNPLTPLEVTSYSNITQQISILKYINQSKQLILGGILHKSSSNSSVIRVIDIGHLLYNGENMITANDWYPLEKNNPKDYIAIPYDKGCLMYKRNDGDNLIYVPIEKCIPHYAKLSTCAIQAYNNPIRIGGIEMNDCFTNIVSRTSPVV